MGYASLSQVGSGLHMRQRSRAFIIADPSNQSSRVVFINADIAMGDMGVRRSIVSQLSSQYPGLYSDKNIAFVGTHQVSHNQTNFRRMITYMTQLLAQWCWRIFGESTPTGNFTRLRKSDRRSHCLRHSTRRPAGP